MSFSPIASQFTLPPYYQPTPKRWVILFYLSILNLLSDWTCYSIAPISILTSQHYTINPEHLVTLFLFCNVISTFFEPFLIHVLGLRRVVVLGSFLLCVGNLCKYHLIQKDDSWKIYASFFLVGLSQPLYQCTPALVSSSWFPECERTLSTGIALNSNQLGIGFAFLISLLISNQNNIIIYFNILGILSTLVFIGCYIQFQDGPEIPPSPTSKLIQGTLGRELYWDEVWYQLKKHYRKQVPIKKEEKKGELKSLKDYDYTMSSTVENTPRRRNNYNELLPTPEIITNLNSDLKYDNDMIDDKNTQNDKNVPILMKTQPFFRRKGFIHSIVAFTASGIILNTLSTYMDYLIKLGGETRIHVGLFGALFQLLILFNSLVVGQVIDQTRAYYSILLGSLLLSVVGLAECGISLDEGRGLDLKVALLLVGVMVGPVQPVATELGVDVVYPLSENTVLVLQQLFSNLLSAIIILIFHAVKNIGQYSNTNFIRPEYTISFFLLIILLASCTMYFATFNGKYVRFCKELGERKRNKENKIIQAIE